MINKIKPTYLSIVIFFVINNLLLNSVHCQITRKSFLELSRVKENKSNYFNIYARSATGNMVGSFSMWGAFTLTSYALSDKNLIATIDCCSYYPILVGGAVGGALFLMANPNPPVKSIKRFWPILVISSGEMLLYHLLIGGPKFRKRDATNNRQAILGSLFVGLTIIPLSHLWYLVTKNRSPEDESPDSFFQDPKSMGLLSVNNMKLTFKYPGIWARISLERPIYTTVQNDQSSDFYISLVNIAF